VTKKATPVRTYGLTHVALAVRDPKRTLRFYQKVFGVVAVYEEDGFIQAQTPGSRDVLVFEKRAGKAGKPGGVAHFGFRLTNPNDIKLALRAVKAAGGEILSHGEFCPGEPYLFFRDPDGYDVEIWYELPTPVDPTEGGT
jgi:catechol 2,3-dioxygenase-like lactoylglutathione lyase family enzyme